MDAKASHEHQRQLTHVNDACHSALMLSVIGGLAVVQTHVLNASDSLDLKLVLHRLVHHHA